jgi:hypothetical protein
VTEATDLLARIEAAVPPESDNPLVTAFERGSAPLSLLGVIAAEQTRIIGSDQRSFQHLADRAAGTPAAAFYASLVTGEGLAAAELPALAAAGGLSAADVAAHPPRPGCQAYPAYVAWLSLYGEPAAVVLAMLANFAAWGSYCGRLAVALRRRYGLRDAACGFFDFFGTPAPELEQLGVAAVQAALDAGADLHLAEEYARLLAGYEEMFWSTLAAG